MSAAALVSFRSPVLAWSDSAEDERLFKRVTSAVLLVTVVLCLMLLLSPKPKPDQSQAQALPPPMAKLLLEHTPEPPPMPKAQLAHKPEVTPEATAPQHNKPEPARAEPPRKSTTVSTNVSEPPKPALVAAEPAPVVDTQAVAVEAARRRVAGLGLLAAKDDIAQVRGATVATQIKTDIRQGSGVGSGAAPGNGAVADAGSLARAMITFNSSGGSGVLNTAAASRNVNSGGLAGRATTVVEDTAARAAAEAAAKRASSKAGVKPQRSSADIAMVLARSKGSLDSIYKRALRDDPTLQGGKVVLELKIAPTGEALSCNLVFSELQSPALESKLRARICMIDFGSQDVDVTVEKYTFVF